MNVGRSGIEAQFDIQRLAGPKRAGEFLSSPFSGTIPSVPRFIGES